MKKYKIITAAIAVITLCAILTVPALAYDDMGSAFSTERITFSLQMTGIGMLMVFLVLALLWGVLSLSRLFCYDIPNRKMKTKSVSDTDKPVDTTEVAEVNETEPEYDETDDSKLAAVITAAVTAMISGDEYKGQFQNGFRVVSFRRAGSGTAWNK